jgi:hygromycin-B 4-O-kinase
MPVRHLDETIVLAALRSRGREPGALAPLAGGEWSQAYAFRDGERELVVRAGDHLEDFQKDRLAMRLASPDLPVPRLLEIDELPAGGYLAVSERVAPGVWLEDLEGSALDTALPAIERMLAAIRNVDTSDTTGYGPWDSEGNAPCPSWSEALLAVSDGLQVRLPGWRAKLEASPTGAGPYDRALAELERLAPEAPDERCPIHADLLHRNVIVEHARIAGVFDWGCAMYGDGAYDLAWLQFWSPWHPGWDAIDVLELGHGIPDLERRIVICGLHIGLANLAYQAFTERWDDVAATSRRMLGLLG